MSGQFYDLLSDHIKVGIRLIDHITLKGGHKPFRVYADDRSNLWLKMNPRLIEIYGAEAAYEQFSKTFHEGVDAFIKGDWPTAQQKLEGVRARRCTPYLRYIRCLRYLRYGAAETGGECARAHASPQSRPLGDVAKPCAQGRASLAIVTSLTSR